MSHGCPYTQSAKLFWESNAFFGFVKQQCNRIKLGIVQDDMSLRHLDNEPFLPRLEKLQSFYPFQQTSKFTLFPFPLPSLSNSLKHWPKIHFYNDLCYCITFPRSIGRAEPLSYYFILNTCWETWQPKCKRALTSLKCTSTS